MKRLTECVVAIIALIALSPLLAALSIAVLVDSPGPVVFRQRRVGQHGHVFWIHKFRTMTASSSGPQITTDGDPRVTRAGRLLRRTKLDELPQLWDVATGRMSLVGPRPEVPRYVAMWPETVKSKVLSVRPGITDPASIVFRYEELLLADAPDPEVAYVESLMPRKLEMYADYVDTRTGWGDVRILIETIVAVVTPSRNPPLWEHRG